MINCLLNALLMLIAILGNILVLAAISRTPSLRSPSNIFLCSLAVSDLLVGLVVQPVYIALVLKPGPGLSDSLNIVSILGCGVSICTMTVISVDRFLALHYHMRYPNLMTEKRAICISTSLWFVLILASTVFIWSIFYARLIVAVGIAICFLITSFLYIRIYQIVRRHQLQIHFQQQAVQFVNAEHNLNMARWKRSVIHTFVYYMCMIVCYSPLFTAMLVLVIFPRIGTNKWWNLTTTAVFMNSSINPVLYCWRLRELRTAVFKTLRKMLGIQTEEN